MAGRVKVLFADREIPFINRDTAIRQVEDLAEKGTHKVFVIYGPEGCGKTAFFKQAAEVLRDHGYSVVHINPMAKEAEERFRYTVDLRELFRELSTALPNPLGDASRLIDLAVELLYTAVRRRVNSRIALLADDVFQAIGLDKAEQLVKSFLNMIEWPSIKYDKIIILVASSEGVTRERVGRHRWASLRMMWNMGRVGFMELYGQLKDSKYPLNDAWGLTGGNPKMLEELYLNNWDVGRVIADMVASRGLRSAVARLGEVGMEVLREAINDPDAIFRRLNEVEVQGLLSMLIEKNLIIEVFDRDQYLWIDQPAPEMDKDLGIGRYYAWQTPLHREAVRKVLEELSPAAENKRR